MGVSEYLCGLFTLHKIVSCLIPVSLDRGFRPRDDNGKCTLQVTSGVDGEGENPGKFRNNRTGTSGLPFHIDDPL